MPTRRATDSELPADLEAVSDTSVLIDLAAAGQIALLDHLFTRVIVPTGVRVESTALPDAPGPALVASQAWTPSSSSRHRTRSRRGLTASGLANARRSPSRRLAEQRC